MERLSATSPAATWTPLAELAGRFLRSGKGTSSRQKAIATSGATEDMGFDVQGVRFLLRAHRSGVQFAKTATIGRQGLFLDLASLQRILRSFGVPKDDAEVTRILTESGGFAEPLLRLLGAEHICSVDASPYEGASMVHDMNLPIPDGLRGAFSVVIDAGTLEHIFDFPTAIKNCMEMVQEGGHLLLLTPTNNFMGHGFYQFSPELFFRVCSSGNGFEVVKAILCEVDPDAPWYEIIDPAKARRRVELVNCRPAYLLIQARKVRQVPILPAAPQQSDYTVLWQEEGPNRSDHSAKPAPLHVRLLRGVGRRLRAVYRMAEPSALAARRRRPDKEVFIPIEWLS
jgi:SAM-dependent methyltransferase